MFGATIRACDGARLLQTHLSLCFLTAFRKPLRINSFAEVRILNGGRNTFLCLVGKSVKALAPLSFIAELLFLCQERVTVPRRTSAPFF